MKNDLSTDTLAVPGVEVLTDPPTGSKKDAGPFYPDELELLRRRAAQLVKREEHFVAKDGHGFSIYRRP